ncbi:MAG: glucans biosynthesis glucosyltransferase MdoH [Gammaproteobacteria bacterium]|nr:glucans biosynthesis glucosyltransferase MdoH [Gammaproteobacteria bacterium]
MTPRASPRAFWRGLLLAVLVAIPSFVASEFLLEVLPRPGFHILNIALAVVFGLLFGWISIGLWISVAGACVSFARWWRRRPPSAAVIPLAAPAAEARTAIVMPVFREDPSRVCAGLEATYRSVAETGRLAAFDFYILSDSNDADAWVEEEVAWAALRRRLPPQARIFYRRRRSNIKRKSGNIADFCRRWGAAYRYMVILDADSVMTGSALTALVDAMEKSPTTGLIQTLPAAVGQNTLFGRIQQFSNRLYGPVFAAGLEFWHMNAGHYWGHNAIIRVAPFVRHCALPRLPGRGAFGGEIMSHDFVEAALLRRAGWDVRLVSGIPGSYEETPPTLLDELKRDRRWAQGNLQHTRLIFARGLAIPHRVVFLSGIMSYMSSLLWLLFLLLSSVEVVLHALIPPRYFPHPHMLFPVWPVWHPHWALMLFWFTLAVLFVPKVLAVLLAVVNQRTRGFGGMVRILAGVALESVLSALLAPVRMLFHTAFVVSVLVGRKTQWGPQARGDMSTSWQQALRYHATGTVLALLWGGAMYVLSPGYFWWLTPVMGAWVAAIPVSVWISRVGPGLVARAWGLFVTPEETAPPAILRTLARLQHDFAAPARLPLRGFLAAVVDPGVNALHCALLRERPALSEGIGLARQQLVLNALKGGPQALGPRERMRILMDRDTLLALHGRIWGLKGPRVGFWLGGLDRPLPAPAPAPVRIPV